MTQATTLSRQHELKVSAQTVNYVKIIGGPRNEFSAAATLQPDMRLLAEKPMASKPMDLEGGLVAATPQR